MKIHPVTLMLRTASFAGSAASMAGTYTYLLHETAGDIILSGAGAGILGLTLYVGWDVTFNHNGWKRLPALLIAGLATGASITTLYQHNQLPVLQARLAVDRQQHHDQQARLAADRQLIEAQIQANRQRIAELETLNKTDADQISDLQKLVNRGIRPTNNAANIAVTRKSISQRTEKIVVLQGQNTDYTNRLLAQPAIEDQPVQPVPVAARVAVDPAMLARASIYDLSTLIFILFAGFYRHSRQAQESREMATLQAAVTQATQETVVIADLQDRLQQTIRLAGKTGEQLTGAAHTAAESTAALETASADAGQHQRRLLQTAGELQAVLEQVMQQRHQMGGLLAGAGPATADLQQGIAAAQAVTGDLQAAHLKCSKSIAAATTALAAANAPASPPASAQKLNELAEDEALTLIAARQLDPGPTGALTTSSIKDATGWGRIRAENLLKTAWESGLLARHETGRGYQYSYPETPDADHQSRPGKIVRLPTARSH